MKITVYLITSIAYPTTRGSPKAQRRGYQVKPSVSRGFSLLGVLAKGL
jgi:hypothetical protein